MIILPGQPPPLPPDLLDRLDGFYPMAEKAGILAMDYSVKKQHGTIASPVFTGGKFGNGMLRMTASSGYAVMPSGAFNYTSQDFSVTFVLRPSDIATVAIYVGNYSYTTYGWGILNYGSGQIGFRTNQAGAVQDTQTSTNAISLGKTSTITAVRSGSTAWIYVDGVDMTTTHGTHVNPATAGPLYLGAYPPYAGTSSGLIGDVGFVMIHSKALTSGQARKIPSVIMGATPRRMVLPQQGNRRRRIICAKAA